MTINPLESSESDPKNYPSSQDPLTCMQQKAWNLWRSHGAGHCGMGSKIVNLDPDSPAPDETIIPVECI